MESAYITLLVFLTVAILVSFLCSILEAVLLSITPTFIAAQRGSLGKRLEKLKKDVDVPLSAILTLNTFAHTIGAAGVGATAQSIWGEASLSIVSAIVTVLILVFSEIVPKTLGAIHWQKLAATTSILCQWLTWMLYPVVLMSLFITRLLRSRKSKSILTRMDVASVVSFGYRDGLIRQHEKEIINNLMGKDYLTTKEIMTPKERLVSLKEDETTLAIHPKTLAWHVSRIPLFSGEEDNITGYVLKDEILAAQIGGDTQTKLSEYRHDIPVVDPDSSLSELYEKLVSEDEHIAVVLKKGRLLGLVTMEDVIEEILGQEIVDESDKARGVYD